MFFPKEYNHNMKLQRIYIDTSVIGGCFDPEFAEWSIGLMNDFRNKLFKPLLSQVTAAEIQEAPKFIQVTFAELVDLNAEIISVSENALELSTEYQRKGILTPNYFNDGLHIALATTAEADVFSELEL